MATVVKKCVFIGLAYFILLPWICSGETIDGTKRLHANLLANYNKDVRPVVNQANPVYLNVSLHLISLQSLEELTGILTFVGVFVFSWMDESMVWDSSLYGGTTYLSISQDKVWFPEFVLLTPANAIPIVGKSDLHKVLYVANGLALFWISERIQSSCDVNVRNYPFDVQMCNIVFNVYGYHPGAVKVVAGNNSVNMNDYIANHAVWDIVNTSITVDAVDVMCVTFKMKRKAAFNVVNVILPITLLGFLNVLVFLLVPESGERISYCITVLLAISVFMTILSDTLPKSSEPVPIISYKLMIDVIISMLITVVTILSLRLYNKDDRKQVPIPLRKMYLMLCCQWFKRRNFEDVAKRYNTDKDYLPDTTNPISVVKASNIRLEFPGHDQPKQGDNRTLKTIEYNHARQTENSAFRMKDNFSKETRITWKDIAGMIDVFAFIIFTMAISSSALLFIFYTRD